MRQNQQSFAQSTNKQQSSSFFSKMIRDAYIHIDKHRRNKQLEPIEQIIISRSIRVYDKRTKLVLPHIVRPLSQLQEQSQPLSKRMPNLIQKTNRYARNNQSSRKRMFQSLDDCRKVEILLEPW